MSRPNLPKLVVASRNLGKIQEFSVMLDGLFDVIPLSQTSFTDEVEETGETFFDNALLKAKAVFERVGGAVLSDDSGLCVEALSGAPGVYSARYAGADATSQKNIALLLQNMEDAKNRAAKFVACLILYRGENDYVTACGETTGSILKAPDGQSGFGYDPVFYSDELKKSFGRADETEKNAISHRGRALVELINKLKTRQG